MELCRILRRETDLPIIMLTAKGEEIDRVLGLELGADDYLTKPFSVRELIARVKNILRRASFNHEHVGKQVITSSDLTVNLTSHTVFVRDKIVDLRPREFDLLVLLMLNRGRVFTRDYVLERLWGYDYIGSNRTVDVHVRWIREKIEQNPSKPNRIVTIRGVGYRFDG
jgi:two-component system OmpR family response regulator